MSMRIAALHRVPLSHLDQVISAQEYPYWAAFYQLEPWGFWADNYHAATVAAAATNATGRYETVRVKDLMDPAPEPEAVPVAQEPDQSVEREIAQMARVL